MVYLTLGSSFSCVIIRLDPAPPVENLEDGIIWTAISFGEIGLLKVTEMLWSREISVARSLGFVETILTPFLIAGVTWIGVGTTSEDWLFLMLSSPNTKRTRSIAKIPTITRIIFFFIY